MTQTKIQIEAVLLNAGDEFFIYVFPVGPEEENMFAVIENNPYLEGTPQIMHKTDIELKYNIKLINNV